MTARPDPFFVVEAHIAPRTDITSTAKLVHAAIRYRVGANGSAWPGTRRIARDIGISKSRVAQAVQELAEQGLMEIENRGNGRSLLYRFPDQSVQPSGRSTRAKASSGLDRVSSRVDGSVQPAGHNQKRTIIRRRARRNSNGGAHQTPIDHFCNSWAARFGAKYPFSKSKDPPAAKRLLASVSGDLKRATRIVDLYLADTDEWLAKRGHRLAILASNAQLPRYLSATAPTPGDTANEASEHPLIEAGRAKWPDSVEAEPAWWLALARRVEDPRSILKLQGAKRLIREAKTLESFKSAVDGKEVASVSA